MWFHVFRDSYANGMGIVWEAYHKGVTLLVVPETPTDTMHPPENHGRNRKKRKDGKRWQDRGSFSCKMRPPVYWKGFSFVSCSVPISEKTETSENSNKNKKTAEPLSARTSDTQLLTKPVTQHSISNKGCTRQAEAVLVPWKDACLVMSYTMTAAAASRM